jgi:hypothetical protein
MKGILALMFLGGLRLKSGLAAVNGDGCAADEGGLIGGDKDDGFGNLLGTSKALERNAGGKSRLAVV